MALVGFGSSFPPYRLFKPIHRQRQVGAPSCLFRRLTVVREGRRLMASASKNIQSVGASSRPSVASFREIIETLISRVDLYEEEAESSLDFLLNEANEALISAFLVLLRAKGEIFEEELQRIRNEHPDDASAVVNDRVKGSLKVTRAFGAGFLKQLMRILSTSIKTWSQHWSLGQSVEEDGVQNVTVKNVVFNGTQNATVNLNIFSSSLRSIDAFHKNPSLTKLRKMALGRSLQVALLV